MDRNTLIVDFQQVPKKINISEVTYILRSYFERRAISGENNEVTQIDVQIESDHGITIYAIVAFKHSSAVDKVLSQSNHAICIQGQTIDLHIEQPQGYETHGAMGYSAPSSPMESNLDEQTWKGTDTDLEPEASTGSLVQVSNYDPDTAEETMRLYFENKRKSGGGDIIDINFDNQHEGNVIITFREDSVAKAVIARSHRLEGKTLTVVPVKKKEPRPKRPVDRSRLLLSGIAEGVSEEMLLLYIERCTNKEEDPTILYGETPGTAMITYSDEIEDLDNAIKKFQKKSLKGQPVTASFVEVPDCILVTNLKPGTSLDNVELYFENKRRSGGGIVREVDFDEERNQAIVYFEDWTVVDRVVKRQHTMSKTNVTVSELFDCLGTSISSDGPTPRLPKEFTMNFDPHLAEYILESGSPHRPRVESEMKREGALIIWPCDENNTTVQVQPVEEKGISADWSHWKERVTRRLTDIFDEFCAEQFVVQQPFWSEVCNKLDSLNLDNVHLRFDSNKGIILLRGRASDVKQAQAKLASTLVDLQQAAEVEKQRVRKSMTVTPEKLKLFFLCHVKENVCQKWPNVHISADSSSYQILLEGLKNGISGAQADIYTQFESLIRRNFPVTQIKAEFIKHVEDKIHEIFTSRNIHAACEIDATKITIVGATDKDVNRARSFVEDDLDEDSVVFKENSTFQSQESLKLLQDINDGKSVLATIDRTGKCIKICGFKSEVEKCSTKVRVFLNENAVIQRHIPLTRGKVRFLEQHAREDLRSITQHQQHSVHVSTELNGNNRGLKVSGTEQGLQNVISSLKILTESIIERQLPITKPGIQDLFGQSNGKNFLDMVQRDCQCVIESHSSDDDDFHDINHQIGTSGPTVQVLRSHTLPSGCKLTVCTGDLTTERVDAIVNAANTELRHFGGLARAIIEKGGDSIQRESEDILRKRGARSLRTAEAVVTGSGNLPCNHIIHVAGPRWKYSQREPGPNDPTTNEEDLLYDSITSVLREAKGRNLTSISIPAVSSGIYGFPVMLCAKTMVESVLQFCDRNRSSSLKEIRFTNNDQRSSDAFLNIFQSQFGGEKRQMGSFEDLNVSSRSDNTAAISTGGDVLTTNEQKRVTLKRGNIATEMVDVVVNTVGSLVQLNQGGVSNAIRAAAGPRLQQECTRVLQQKGLTRLQPGDFITTSAAKLNCKAVYHACCDNYRDAKSKQILSTLMQTILTQANRDGSTSIAIPAIGTGYLGFPPKVTAQLMFEEALNFSQQNPSGSLSDIRFVVYQQDHSTITAFENELKNLHSQGSNFQGSAVGGSQRSHRRLKKEGGNHSASGGGSTKDGTTRMKTGALIVELQQGDITKETTDAIVNSVGHDLGLRGPVSRAILKAGGNDIKRECDRIRNTGGRYTRQEVFKTTAGNLPCKIVIHVTTPHSLDKLKGAVWEALQLADQEKCVSLAFPALGTGVVAVGGDPVAAAASLVDIIGEFAVQGKPRALRLVKITIYEQNMFAVYKDTLSSKVGAGNRESKGMFRRGLDYVWSVISGAGNVNEEAWEKPSDDTIFLHIFAKSSRKIDEAMGKIDDFIKREYYSEEIPLDPHLYSEIDDTKMKHKLSAIGAKNKVEILPILDGRAKRVSIQGRHIDVKSAYAEIQAYFVQIQLEQTKKAEDQLINKQVQWKYKDSTGIFVEYGDEINPIIERAQREERPYVQINLEEGGILIDFETMTETSQGRGASSAAVDIHRCDLKTENTFHLPLNWNAMTGQNSTVALAVGPEMNQVQSTFQGLVGRQIVVHKIERIQILDLYKRYEAIKERMQTTVPNGVQAERTLYHAVNHNITGKINSNGFDRADSGRTDLGMGVYFSSNVLAIDQMAPGSGPSSRKYVYVCKVLTGVPEQGRQSMISPSQNASNPGNPYDSAVDNVSNPTWFVVFKDGQAYPEYLIEYL